MNDDQLLLASAYLDDDVDEVARARAEADPEVMAEVARQRALRVALRDVDMPRAAARDRAIAAALAAFADEPAPVVAPPAPVPLPQRPRRAWWGAGLAAAALVAVVAAGVALSSGTGGGGDDDAASGTLAQIEATLSAADATAERTDEAGAAAPQPADSEHPEGADSATGDATAATDGATAESTTAAATQAADLTVALTTPDDLVAFATRAVDKPAATGPPAACPEPGTYVGRATYDGTPVEVYVDGASVTAVDAVTCGVVQRVGR